MGEHLLIYQLFGEHHLARWCSRLARQPVTLEVDGSSPFRVAKSHPFGMALFLCFFAADYFLKNLKLGIDKSEHIC